MKCALASALLVGLVLSPASSRAGSAVPFREIDLASDLPGRAAHQDSSLVNPWGIAQGHDGSFRIAANGSGLGLLLFADGRSARGAITIPPPDGGNPSGVVSDGAEDFTISDGHRHGKAELIFVSEDGSVSAWSPALDRNSAIRVATTTDAVYKGVAIGSDRHGPLLYAANFHAGSIDVFDRRFRPVTIAHGFEDTNLPAGYAPFNIANLEGRLYVCYAKQDPDAHDDVPGAGFGFIDVFDTNGRLLQRLVSQGPLDAPWGLALTPEGFGAFRHALLVGNFGDGEIHAFDRRTGALLGGLEDDQGQPIAIDGLWGLGFAGEGAGDRDDWDGRHGRADRGGRDGGRSLFFTAGIHDEANGLFGRLEPVGKKDLHGDEDSLTASSTPPLATSPLDPGVRVELVGPNPVRTSDGSGIRFRITSGGPAVARIGIFDLAGRLVAEPAKDVPFTGTLEARWDGRMLRGGRARAGAYFYRVEAGGGMVRGNLILTR
jgi:uncharacterized protein (TIGR03118 family)